MIHAHFHDLPSLLHMGGYAAYVWPAVGFFVLTLAWNIVHPWRRYRQLTK